MAKVDKKEEALRDSYAATKKKYGADSDQALKARGKLNDYLESIGRNTNRVAGEPINGQVKAATPQTPVENPGPDNTQSSGVQTAVVGSGNPLDEAKKSDVKNLFDDFAKQATASANIYEDVMPLNQLNPALSTEQTAALGNLQTAANLALQRDPRQEQMLDMYLRNAEQGMSQPELVALQEAGVQGINNSLQDVLRQLTLKNAGSGISGPAQTIGQQGAALTALQARRDLERDMIQKNLDFKQHNLDTGFANAQSSNNNYFSNLSQAGQNFWTGSTAAAQQVLETQKWNADQSTNFAAGKLGALVGGADWGAQQHFAEEANNIAKQAIAASKAAPGGGTGGAQAAGYSGSSLGEGYKAMKTSTAGQPQSY